MSGQVQQISGEYAMVARRSRNYALLKDLHETPCGQQVAKALIENISREFGVKVSAIRFKEWTRGRAYYKTSSLCLPATPGKGFGYLRIGIVLHEIAHLIAFHRFRERAHRAPFIKTLDFLVQDWRKYHVNPN